jgi:hypothetical protein
MLAATIYSIMEILIRQHKIWIKHAIYDNTVLSANKYLREFCHFLIESENIMLNRRIVWAIVCDKRAGVLEGQMCIWSEKITNKAEPGHDGLHLSF